MILLLVKLSASSFGFSLACMLSQCLFACSASSSFVRFVSVFLFHRVLVSYFLKSYASFTRRREDDKNATRERLDAIRKGRGAEGLAKIRGPEWGITELDFEGDYNAYENQEMKREYDGAGKGVTPTAYKASSHRARQQSVSAQAWMQEVSGLGSTLPT